MLFDYEQLISYLQKLDTTSPRLKLVEIGKSPLGKKMYIAFLSSEENISNLENLKTINRRLALDPNIPELERESLFKEGKVFFLPNCGDARGQLVLFGFNPVFRASAQVSFKLLFNSILLPGIQKEL